MNEGSGDGLLEPIADIAKSIKELISPFSDPILKELGEYVAGRIRFVHFKRSLKVLEQAKALLDKRGISPRAVNLRILVPLLENVGLEDDDDLIGLWSGLLASAATDGDILPSFVHILSEISPDEARILDYIYIHRTKQNLLPNPAVDKAELEKAFDLDPDAYGIRLLNLLRLGLIEEVSTDAMIWRIGYGAWGAGGTVGLTALGEALIRACNGPQPIKLLTKACT